MAEHAGHRAARHARGWFARAVFDSDVFYSFYTSPVTVLAALVTVGFFADGDLRALGRAARHLRPVEHLHHGCGAAAGVDRRRRCNVSCWAPTIRGATCSRRSCIGLQAVADRRLRLRASSRSCSAWRSAWCSGYVGGTLDDLLMRIADVQLSFPAILIALLVDGIAKGLFSGGTQNSWRSSWWCFAIGDVELGAVSRAPCAARPWSRRTRNTCRPRGSSACRPWIIVLRHVLPNVHRAGAGHRHHQPGARHHHRGDPVVSSASASRPPSRRWAP